MITLVLATRNAHKVGEIRSILGDGFRYLTLNDLQNPPAIIEDANSFSGNATKKAVGLAKWISGSAALEATTGRQPLYVLADDSGLEVDAIGGAPGVHSARFAGRESGQGGNSPDAENNAKLLRLLTNLPPEKRTARFRCVLALTPVIAPPPGTCFAHVLRR